MRCDLNDRVGPPKGGHHVLTYVASGFSRTRQYVASGFSRTVIAAMALSSFACNRPPAAAPAAVAAPAVAVPHGDHNPHHGGIVMMKGDDLHYEVVLDPAGRGYSVYFTDAVREELPAALASTVELTIKRPGASDERVALRIDDAGESWVGSGRPVDEPAATTVRVAFSIRNEPYWIDLPFKK